MGYDAFWPSAEQYAIQTSQHPEVTTRINTAKYRGAGINIGFSFDWSREVMTSDPNFYKWTQWAFIKMFESYYDNNTQKARPIEEAHSTLLRKRYRRPKCGLWRRDLFFRR